MWVFDFLRSLLPGFRATGSASMDQYLISKGCVIVPFTAFLTNPDKPVLKVTPENFKEFIPVYMKSFSPVYIYRKGSEYYILSTLFGMQTSL